MKIKFFLVIVLLYDVDFFIMDELIFGFDFVFRREFLDLFLDLIQDEIRFIIFLIYIMMDLECIVDYIVFVNQGKLVFNEMKDDVFERYMIVKGDMELLDGDIWN